MLVDSLLWELPGDFSRRPLPLELFDPAGAHSAAIKNGKGCPFPAFMIECVFLACDHAKFNSGRENWMRGTAPREWGKSLLHTQPKSSHLVCVATKNRKLEEEEEKLLCTLSSPRPSHLNLSGW